MIYSVDEFYQTETENVSKHNVPDEVLIFAPFVILGLGALLRHSTKSLPIPYTMQLLLVGAFLGFLLRYEWWEDTFQQSVEALGNMDPHLMLHIFLPPLIFESAASLEWYLFSKAKWFIFSLAGPGIFLASTLTGLVLNTIFHNSEMCAHLWFPEAGFLLGVILSATDPVAVVALLKVGNIEVFITGVMYYHIVDLHLFT